MRRTVFLACASALVAAATPFAATAQCVVAGTGGAIPAAGSGGGGAWPSALPGSPTVGALTVPSVASGSVLKSVVLRGLSHSWFGDLQFVLEDPTGARHNLLHRVDFLGTGFGCGANPVGIDITLVDPLAGNACGGPPSLTCSSLAASGTFRQYVGNWPTGAIDNVSLESIPHANLAGAWKLYVYDWAAGDVGTLTSWELCFGPPTTPPGSGGPVLNCVTGGGGGNYPSPAALGGTWPTTLPTGPLVAPLSVTIPAGATKILAVNLRGLNHSWLGDSQIVLQAPSGQRYNLFQDNNGVFAGGCGDPVSGDYSIVDAAVGVDPCGAAAQSFSCTGTAPGAYRQAYGAWPSGSSGILNTNLQSIPIGAGTGTWRVIIYDWFVAADGGSLSSWDLCFDVQSLPLVYCTAGTTTSGCSAAISANANPNVTHSTPVTISVANVEGQKQGLVFYGINNTGFTPLLWGTGSTSFLCVKAPTQRTINASSGGTANACNGVLSLNWNAYITATPTAVGVPFVSGAKVYLQAWFRDPPAPKTTNLSNALEFTYTP